MTFFRLSVFLFIKEIIACDWTALLRPSSFGLVTLLETWSLSYDSHVRKEENIMVLLDNDGVRIFSFSAFFLMISCNRSLVNLSLHLDF